MKTILDDLQKGLQEQLADLAKQIRSQEEQAILTKEGYLKVVGALEIISVIQTKQQEAEDQETKDALTVAGLD
jgi:exopolysaccharide biosynthesis protein